QRIRALDAEWVAKQERLAAELFTDLRLLLDAEQLGRWDGVHRWRHRARLLRWCELPYGKLMVSSIARSMNLQPDPSRFVGDEASVLNEVYGEYEIELDRMLLERAAVEREHVGVARGMGGDPATIGIGFVIEPEELAWQEAVGAMNVRLVAMQKMYIRRISSLVEPEKAVAFERRCREEAYPHVLGQSHAQRSINALVADEGLSEEQRVRVEQMSASYSSERDAMNERWVRMIEAVIAEGAPHVLASPVPVFLGDQRSLIRGDRTFFEMSDGRRALDERWMRRVRDLRAEFARDTSEEEGSDG
ncbi:MAG: hypothetical protein ACNA8P_11625, partial [Phycisphaerales bacterium]